jgi:AcrR family transcriptional regulator
LLIAEKGLEGLRTRDIAAKVGINISTLHHYFATKQALVVGVVGYVSHLFMTVRAPLPPNHTSLDELRGMFESHAYRQRAVPQLGVVVQEIMLRARRDEQIAAAIAAGQSAWHTIVEDILTRCREEGYLRPWVQPHAADAVITSFLIGADVQFALTPSKFSLERSVAQLLSCLIESDARS